MLARLGNFFDYTYIKTIRNTCTNNHGSVEILLGDEWRQIPRSRLTNVSSEGTTTVSLGIVKVVNLRRLQEFPIFGIRREGEWHTL
jgi:hypothetical protein